MLKSAASKVMWVGRATVFVVGLAVILALVFGVASTAFGHKGYKGLFHLGHNNATSAISTLTKSGVGPALSLKVGSGAPLAVNSSTKVANLHADRIDNREASSFANATHPHDGGDITSGTVADARIDSSVARDAEVMDNVKANDGSGSNLDADLLDGRNATDFTSAYKSTVVVSPVGTPQQNGTALKNALTSITTASATNPYLLKIEPGVYELGAAPGLQMKEWVDIEGSGEGVTILTASGSASFTTGTVVGAANSELRFLTVKNTGGADRATAVYSTANPFRLTHVTTHVSGATTSNTGVRIESGVATLREATFIASGSSQNLGVFVSSSATLSQVTATGSGGTANYGVGANSNNNVEIRDSQIVGATNTVRDFGSPGVILVGASQLVGGPAEATCAGVYDENYVFSASTCPS